MSSNVYLAGPMKGLSYTQTNEWREYVTSRLEPLGIHCLSPLRDQEYLAGEQKLNCTYNYPLSSSRAIYTQDRFDVERSDVILVNFLGSKAVSIGTVFEIAWGALLRKIIIIVMEKDNVHEHPFVSESSSIMIHTLDEGIELVKSIVDPFPKILLNSYNVSLL